MKKYHMIENEITGVGWLGRKKFDWLGFIVSLVSVILLGGILGLAVALSWR